MRSIMFNVRPEVKGEQQTSLLADVTALPGIRKALALRPNSKNASVSRMCYAEVADDADVNELVQKIRVLPEVETANLPAERHLM
jgi:NADPH-dependent ferric siderophore reductase